MDPDARLITPGAARALRRKLLAWYDRNRRALPWRRTDDPYRIWLSEIMLQQTRAQAVIPYYHRFLNEFPDVDALAAAPEKAVLAAWSGLGYYSRARNLRTAAQQVARAGAFPREFESIRELPGVGDYTAAAVASIAFGLPHAVLDGNVMRVLARLLNDSGEISSTPTKRRLRDEAHRLLDRRHPGRFNQAMMELGATVCVPRSPKCGECPLDGECLGYRLGTAATLPVKLRKKEPVEIRAAVTIVMRAGRVLLWERPADSGRMAGFWELPEPSQLPGLEQLVSVGTFRHAITHHRYIFQVTSGIIPHAPRNCRWIPRSRLRQIPLSTIARKALRLYFADNQPICMATE
jgi:A/G-specific adenine glycosylase